MRIISSISFILLFTITSFAQTMNTKNNYEAKWKSVENAFKKGLNATAEKEILAILQQAKSDHNHDQILKAICNYRVSMKDREETDRLNDILFFEKELKSSEFPTTQVLHSMLGDLYWTYYTENRWKILERTQIASPSTHDSSSSIETWSANQFYDKAFAHYELSLSNVKELQKYKLNQFSEMIDKGENTLQLRPTLYDFLIHRAIDYFSIEETEITQPTYAFEIDDEKAFSPVLQFVDAKFKTSDITSRKYMVLKLYQEVLKFHLNDKNLSALVDADIARLQYVNHHSISSNTNQWYLNSLEKIIQTYPSIPETGMAMYFKAETYIQGTAHLGKRGYMNSTIQDDKINYIEAKKICDDILEKFPKTEAAFRAENLLQQIEVQTIQLTTEKVVIPNQASLAKVDFRNINTLYCKIIKLTTKEYKDASYDYSNQYEPLLKRNAIKTWEVKLPLKSDYKNHSTEIKIDALPIGTYALIVSQSNQFEKNNYTALSFLNVSNLSYIIATNSEGRGVGIYTMNRESGEPLSNVTVKTWINNYDYNTRKYQNKLSNTYTTDLNGFSKLKFIASEGALGIEVIKGEDDLFMNDQVYSNEYVAPYQEVIRTFLFTDRSMYRPGQKIFFKGIMVESKGDKKKEHALVKGRRTTVRLMDANYQEVTTAEFNTNEFGSFSGSFTAPEGLLTGQFSLVNEGGNIFFNVEEYKRPKFEVTIDTLKASYKLNDSIQIKGNAKAYAGNSIDGATVKYRVIRAARFPYYWCFYRWGQPVSAEMEIAHGIGKTDKDGSFSFVFKAIPDQSINPKTMPVFSYRIEADVTDVNGETRSGNSSIEVSYQSLLLGIEIPSQIDLNEFKKVTLTSTNLGGVFIPSDITIKCTKLVSPSKTYRSRLWPKVEIQSFTEEEFRKQFPLDEYKNENDYQEWKEEKLVWSKVVKTTESGVVEIPAQKYVEGWYVIEANTKDKDGVDVLEKKFIRMSNFANPEALPNEHILVSRIKLSAQPGEKAKIGIGSADGMINLLYQTGYQHGKATWKKLNGNQFFEYPISESDRGGFYVNALFVKHNRMYNVQQFIDVPWTNKQLKISVETFRDKILPGSEQEWKLKISGANKEKVSAEVLATMYDASLDAFKPHSFQDFNLFQTNHEIPSWSGYSNFAIENGRQVYYRNSKQVNGYNKLYSQLEWWGMEGGNRYQPFNGISPRIRYAKEYLWENNMGYRSTRGGKMMMADDAQFAPAAAALEKGLSANREESKNEDESLSFKDNGIKVSEAKPTMQMRSNFSETAFFYPSLRTDSEGNIVFSFKAPDALTRWKLLAFGHTQELQSGQLTATTITQKELMIVPNTPRFFREGDYMVYTAKVTNLSNVDLQGSANLELSDAIGNQSLDNDFNYIKRSDYHRSIFVKKGESIVVKWQLKIPQGVINPVLVKTTVQASRTSSNGKDLETIGDGEQNIVPVLLNSMLVTETLPLPVKTNSSKTFSFDKLLRSKESSSLRHHKLTLEYTGNPAWYAVQSLPYLTEYPYDCAEQTFNRYYANVLASHIANSNPTIKKVYQEWSGKDTGALLSNLQKNQELKSALLQETPWVLEANNEADQKRELATLFNLNRMSGELHRTLHELELMQTPNGGFTWFKGMPDDRFMTQYIITGVGRLMHLGLTEIQDPILMGMVEKAIPYLDARMKEDYDNLIKNKIDLKSHIPSAFEIQFLYMRSFYLNNDITEGCSIAFNYYKTQSAKYWTSQNKYMQAMLSLALHRYGQDKVPMEIIRSLRENAIHSDELGMYWKQIGSSYWWYEAPIETQSVMIEAFKEIALNEEEVDELKIWLLKNKQTQHWQTTKATADACYALLLNGSYTLSYQPNVTVSLGDNVIKSSDQKTEAGTGYFKRGFASNEITPSMGNIHVQVEAKDEKGAGVKSTTWGAIYWQYFENLDKITSSETPLKLKKELFIERNSDKGPILIPIKDGDELQVGDKVNVRIELRVDRDMEYLHMKDMRGACFEPTNVLSSYKYQGGLGYYEATKDAATNFFFNWVMKGTYVFEYKMFVTNQGDFSNGITTIQSMYAPEFSSHSEGLRVKVK